MNDNHKKRKNEILLWSGSIATKLGNKVFDYGANEILAHLSGNGIKILALYQGSEVIISVICYLFAGVKVDKYRKKRILIITDFLSGMVCFLLCTIVKNSSIGLILVCMNILLAVFSSFNEPAVKGLVGECVDKDRIIKLNAALRLSSEIVRIFGPIIGLIVLRKVGIKGTFFFNGTSFLIAACMESLIIVFSSNTNWRRRNTIIEIIEGFKYIKENKEVLCIIIVSAGVNFFLAGYNLFLPLTNSYLDENMYSMLLTAEAIGGVLGAMYMSRKNMNSIIVFLRCLGFSGGGLSSINFLMKLRYRNILIFLFVGIFSFFLCIYNISSISYVQCNVDKNYIGRVFSVIYSVVILFMPLGTFFFSLLKHYEMAVFSLAGFGIVLLSIISSIVIKKNNIL